MEDFIQVLVFLLFIVLSIASARKKKSKTQTSPKPRITPNKQNAGGKPKAYSQNNKTNILEELLGIKLPEPEPQKTGVPNYSTSTYYNPYEKLSAEAEKRYEQENEDGISDYYDQETEEKKELISEKDKHKAFKTESSFTEIEQLKHEIHSMISDRSNLKNYVIIQEILNKPKALRR